jgi:peptide/nickel transport system substrate-binding protein
VVTNTTVPALGDVHVRRAMNYALNRDQLNEAVFRGVGHVPNSMLMPYELNADEKEVPTFEYNLKKAEEEMAKSKFPGGFSVKLQSPAGLDYYKQMVLLMQQELSAIGIDVKLEELEAATVAEQWANGEFEMTFPFPESSSDEPVPDEVATFYALPEAGLDGFKSFWTDPHIEMLVKKFLSTTNEATRKPEWKVIQEAFNEEMPSLNVMDFPFVNAHQTSVCGTQVNAIGVDQLQETWIAEKSS